MIYTALLFTQRIRRYIRKTLSRYGRMFVVMWFFQV